MLAQGPSDPDAPKASVVIWGYYGYERGDMRKLR